MEENDQEIQIGPMFYADIYFLSESKSAEEFYHRLGKMIYDVPKYDEEELKSLSELISKPWKRKKGRPFDEQRVMDIRFAYYEFIEDYGASGKKTNFVKLIATKYKLEFDAARKAVEKAFRPTASSTDNTDDIPF